ncbi:MAG: SoxR reducing system RseC family protein [Evtepia sp.]
MTQIARVKKTQDDGMAEIAVDRKSACAHDCGDCAGCSKMVEMAATVVIAENKIGAQNGDIVLVESSSAGILTAAMMVYIVPFALFFICYGIGAALNMQENFRILISCIGFVVGIGGAIFWDRREKKQHNLRFSIVEIKDAFTK